MKRVIFKFRADHVVDLITNSSSELFVLRGKTLEIVTSLIEEQYPNYESEYEKPVPTSEMSADQLYTYIDREFNGWSNSMQKQRGLPIPGFKYEDMYTVPDWAARYAKEQKREPERYLSEKFIEDNLDAVRKALDPNGEMFFLFSLDENPDGEMQDRLSQIGDRYHLG